MRRYPCTTGLVLVLSAVFCVAWLLTHDACLHPIGNTVAFLWAFVACPLLVGVLAGGEV